MLIERRIPLKFIFGFGLKVVTGSSAWAGLLYGLYAHLHWDFLRVPFLPIATIGTAVAFYVGFKNNSAYERFWEGRKIWGGIVNESRTWAAAVLSYVDVTHLGDEAPAVQRELIYRQLAWINSLRVQLRARHRFEVGAYRKTAERLSNDEEHMRNDWQQEVAPFLSDDERAEMTHMANPASQILRKQTARLAELHGKKQLDLFHQIDLMQIVRGLYALQGKSERIKNTPFPRLYAEYSRWFTRIFLMLVPMGLLDVFVTKAEGSTQLDMLSMAVPMCISAGLISWVFFTMEGIGDASEDPFERSMNDVPMNALCVTIERDLRQMLGESEIPEPELPAGSVMY